MNKKILDTISTAIKEYGNGQISEGELLTALSTFVFFLSEAIKEKERKARHNDDYLDELIQGKLRPKS